jgi:hypothetical protein
VNLVDQRCIGMYVHSARFDEATLCIYRSGSHSSGGAQQIFVKIKGTEPVSAAESKERSTPWDAPICSIRYSIFTAELHLIIV